MNEPRLPSSPHPSRFLLHDALHRVVGRETPEGSCSARVFDHFHSETVYQREEGGAWRYRALEAGEKVLLSTGTEIEVDAVYEGAFSFGVAS